MNYLQRKREEQRQQVVADRILNGLGIMIIVALILWA